MKCQICGNSDQNVEYEVREMLFGIRDRFSLYSVLHVRMRTGSASFVSPLLTHTHGNDTRKIGLIWMPHTIFSYTRD